MISIKFKMVEGPVIYAPDYSEQTVVSDAVTLLLEFQTGFSPETDWERRTLPFEVNLV